MPAPERLSDAETVLAFARPFGMGFRLESEESIREGPRYLRAIIGELQQDSQVAWARIGGRNQKGVMAHVFVDDSCVGISIAHILDAPRDPAGLMPPPPEVRVEIFANAQERMERVIEYTLGRGDGRVIRTDIYDDLGVTIEDYEEGEEEAEQLPLASEEAVRAISAEAVILKAGIDPSFDPDIEQMRALDDDFRQASDDQRRRLGRETFERYQGLNHQPVGLRELADLRRAILSPDDFLRA